MRSHSLSGFGVSVLFFMFQLKSGHGAEGGLGARASAGRDSSQTRFFNSFAVKGLSFVVLYESLLSDDWFS